MALPLRITAFNTILFGFIGVFGCSSLTEPSEPPTLFVTNPLCGGSQCREVRIGAYITTFTVPQAPQGSRNLGIFSGPTACLRFPPSWELAVHTSDSSGAVISSDTMTWTPDDALYLTVVDMEASEWLAKTQTFTPGDEEGWVLTLSPEAPGGGLPNTAHLSPGEKCTPS
jgi:hypothetical protein